MPYAGKFGRLKVASAAVGYMSGWKSRFRRERLDTTNFESAASTYNVFSDGLTGVLDTTFNVDGYVDVGNAAVFFPAATLSCDFIFNKTSGLGYLGIAADVLGFEPGGQVRQLFTFSAELQSNGAVA
jgi:hypothetical protein